MNALQMFDAAAPVWWTILALSRFRGLRYPSEVFRLTWTSRPARMIVLNVKRLSEAYAAAVLPLHANAREALHLERRVSDLVNAAYGLTPDDVALLWATAPPRMPFAAPA